MLYLTGEKIPWDGVNEVRNKLIEHCHDQDLKNDPLLINSIEGNHETGPRLKGIRRVNQSLEAGMYNDKGLYVNGVDFLNTLTERLHHLALSNQED